jgi:hypothetical protein
MMTAFLGLAAMVALMAIFTIFFYWYCHQIRDGRIDLYTNPEWTSTTGPASPGDTSAVPGVYWSALPLRH